MAFNFGGMMRGLGAGLTQTGAWMKEQEKLDWETQQATLRYEREMHMEGLRTKASKESQERGITSSEKIAGNQITSQEKLTGMQIGAQNANADRAYGLDMKRLSIQEQEAAAAAGARGQAASNDAARLKIAQDAATMEAEKYNASKPEAQIAMREKQRSALVESGIPKEYVEVYVQTGNLTLPKKDGKDISVNGENILKAKEMGTAAYDLMDESEQTRFNTANGIKGNDKAAGRKAMGDMSVNDLLYTATGTAGPPTGGGMLAGGTKPGGKVNLREEIQKATSGDAEAEGRLQALQKQNPTDSLIIDANREVAASKQKKVPEASSSSTTRTPSAKQAQAAVKKATATEVAIRGTAEQNDLALKNHGKEFKYLTAKQQSQIRKMVD